jgi:hypothetical protein
MLLHHTLPLFLLQVLNSAFNRHGFTFYLAGAQTYRASSQYLYKAGPGSQAEFEIKRQLRMGGAADLNIYTWAPGDGMLGWATFPWDYQIGSPSSALDGVVVRTATLPGGTARDYNLGNTVVHEVCAGYQACITGRHRQQTWFAECACILAQDFEVLPRVHAYTDRGAARSTCGCMPTAGCSLHSILCAYDWISMLFSSGCPLAVQIDQPCLPCAAAAVGLCATCRSATG